MANEAQIFQVQEAIRKALDDLCSTDPVPNAAQYQPVVPYLAKIAIEAYEASSLAEDSAKYLPMLVKALKDIADYTITGAEVQNDLMHKWDIIREMLLKKDMSDFPRRLFENAIENINDFAIETLSKLPAHLRGEV
jgi:hypothetical protein